MTSASLILACVGDSLARAVHRQRIGLPSRNTTIQRHDLTWASRARSVLSTGVSKNHWEPHHAGQSVNAQNLFLPHFACTDTELIMFFFSSVNIGPENRGRCNTKLSPHERHRFAQLYPRHRCRGDAFGRGRCVGGPREASDTPARHGASLRSDSDAGRAALREVRVMTIYSGRPIGEREVFWDEIGLLSSP